MVKYALTHIPAAVSAAALQQSILPGSEDVEVALPSSRATRIVKRALLECDPYLAEHIVKVRNKPTLCVFHDRATGTRLDISLWGPTARITLPDVDSEAFFGTYLTWMVQGVDLKTQNMDCYEWAKILKVFAHLQPRSSATQQITKAMSNRLYDTFFDPDPPEYAYTSVVLAYKQLKDFDFRFLVVRLVALTLLRDCDATLSASLLMPLLRKECPEFAVDLMMWQSILPHGPNAVSHGLRGQGQCAIGGKHNQDTYEHDRDEHTAWTIDQVLLPLLFTNMPMPDQYRPKWVKRDEDVRRMVRKYLGMGSR